MTDVISPVPTASIDMPKSSTRVIRFTVKRPDSNGVLQPVVLNVGCQLIFTARAKQSDAVPAIQKSYVANAVTPHLSPDPGGIIANTGVGVGIADMTLSPSDTEDLDVSILSYDLWLLVQSTGEEVPILQGTLRISPTVFRP